MYQAPEQLIAFNKANLEAAARFAGVALQGAERLVDLQLKAAKEAFADGIENAKALASVKDPRELASLRENLTQPRLDKATALARSFYDVAAATQAEFGKLVETQVSEFNRQVVAALDRMVKNAPAGSDLGIAAMKSAIAAANTAYDSLSKAAKQMTEATQSNLEAVVKQATDGGKKSRK
jgi:phasin family protein